MGSRETDRECMGVGQRRSDAHSGLGMTRVCEIY